MITRRVFLGLSTRGLAALVGLLPILKACSQPSKSESSPGEDSEATGPLDWEAFLAAVAGLAELQFMEFWDQEAYVEEVAALMRTLNPQDPTLLRHLAESVGTYRNFPDIVTLVEGEDHAYDVAVVIFEAGEEIPLHDHPDMTGVILGLSGNVQIESYDILPEASAEGNLLLKQLWSGPVRPGELATLTATRGNVHYLKATERTELLDVFTPGYNQERSNRSRWFRRSESPVEGSSDTYEAWED